MPHFAIDRFEGEWAVLEDEQRRTFNVPRAWLPAKAREGDVLKLSVVVSDSTGSVVFALDPDARDDRERQADQLHGQLPRGPMGDISL